MSVVLPVFLQNAFKHIRRVLANYNIQDWKIHQACSLLRPVMVDNQEYHQEKSPVFFGPWRMMWLSKRQACVPSAISVGRCTVVILVVHQDRFLYHHHIWQSTGALRCVRAQHWPAPSYLA